MKSSRIVKTVRLTPEVVEASAARAAELGLTFSDLVEAAMGQFLGVRDPAFDVLEAVRGRLLDQYPDRKDFPQNVTLTVFQTIRADPGIWSLYEEAVNDDDGKLVIRARDSLHRRIGKAVKTVLDAEVVGRSLPLDAEVELINSHALLVPKGSDRTVK